ncbi:MULTISPECIES: GNVR domain-containing protein [unclassified Sphingomonas]|uniref:GNVR domain-containing protein n=1 Tax=unclassified Sphingomonas TaxID=196159 RepID=UPI000A6FB675|nr:MULTISPECIES: GNVR domain-containing protein [unclassified Sphingomonas]
MMSFSDLISAIRHRLRTVIIVGLLVFGALVALAMVQKRQYSASSSLLVDLTQSDTNATNANGNTQQNASVIDTIIGTQIDIIRSNAVLEEVARTDPAFQSPAFGETAEQRIQNASGLLRRQLMIGSEKGSNVIRLSYTSTDPEAAAATLNRIVDTYLTKQVELRTSPARNSAKWYDERTRAVRERFELAQTRLSDFQRANGIVGVDRMDIEGDRAKNLSTELVQAQAEAAAARARATSTDGPEVESSTIVQELQREVGMQAGKVAELSKTLGAAHPTMVAATAQLSALRSELAKARSTQAGALDSASLAAGRREAELRSKLEQQQQRMLSMSGVQDQLNVLQRDVDATRQTYDTVRQRFNEASLRSEISQANASRLDQAVAPLLPSTPNLPLWFAAALVLGLGAGIGAAAAQEFVRPRLRTASGTASALDLDVIVDMTALDGSGRHHSNREFAA